MTARARKTDPVTSWVAAATVSQKAKAGERKALYWIVQAKGWGLTDFELATKTGCLQTSIGVRRCALVRQGLVEASGPLGFSPSGHRCMVWVATRAGREALAKLEAKQRAA